MTKYDENGGNLNPTDQLSNTIPMMVDSINIATMMVFINEPIYITACQFQITMP